MYHLWVVSVLSCQCLVQLAVRVDACWLAAVGRIRQTDTLSRKRLELRLLRLLVLGLLAAHLFETALERGVQFSLVLARHVELVVLVIFVVVVDFFGADVHLALLLVFLFEMAFVRSRQALALRRPDHEDCVATILDAV